MIAWLQKKYALSQQGAKDLVKGCFACLLQNLSFMVPVGLLFLFVQDLMAGGVTGGGRVAFYLAGCLVCLTADTSSETKWLPRDIGVCIAHGLDEKEAFKGVTINPAKLLGIEDKVGSLEAGKDADVAIFDGHPFSNMTHCVLTMIDGEIYHNKM